MMADIPIPEVAVPLGEGCLDLTTGKPYVPAAAAEPPPEEPATA